MYESAINDKKIFEIYQELKESWDEISILRFRHSLVTKILCLNQGFKVETQKLMS